MQEPSGQVTASALQALLTGRALAGEWVLDPRRISIRLKNKMIGLVPVTGVFRQVAGNGTVSADGEVSGAVTVAAASIDTKNARRDRHLRSADFFDSDNPPNIIFAADGVRPSGLAVAVTGALTVRGRTVHCRSMPRRPSRATARSGSTPGAHQPGRLRPDLESDGHGSMRNTLTIHSMFTRR
jgi:YceI-like domain